MQQSHDITLTTGLAHLQLNPSHHYHASAAFAPQPPVRQDSFQYQSLDTQLNGSQQQQQTRHGMTGEELEEMEDRRRMQQQILQDKLTREERKQSPNTSAKMTTNEGFGMGTFDMSDSLAIVEDLLDYFGEDDLTFEGGELFNESQLIEAERTHLRRESLVRHLYDSEEDYLRSLQEIQSCYRKPLLRNLQQIEDNKKSGGLLSSSLSKIVATKQEIDTMFGNLGSLIEFHEEIRSLLEERSRIWGPTQIIGDLLISVIPKFKIYSMYFLNFHHALTVLDRISRGAQYKKFMEQCVSDNPSGTASLHLMLATPLRRLSTFRDMINALCQATSACHPDYLNLIRASDMINVVANELQNEQYMAQDQLALWDIQSTMVNLPEPIMIPARRLILRADLHKVDSSLALEPRTYYLMNDVLLYARFDPKKNIYTFKGMFDLAKTQINNPEDNVTLPQLPNCIQIANAGRKQMMRCRSRDERDYWMETMRRVVEIINKNIDNPSMAVGDLLPLRKYANSIASDSSLSLGYYPGVTSGSTKSVGNSSNGNTFMDSRSITSKSSNETASTGASKPRKPNPQADFYGCSFGKDVTVSTNEDNYKPSPLALNKAMANNQSSSTVSSGASSTTATSTNGQSLGAMLAAIPQEELTPKQAKAKAALAAAVEARRQARLKQEMKNGGSTAKKEMDKNVSLDFSSSFIPAKARLGKS
ncbi:hypothetical protein BX616_004565 [Lobosporangium transversale]|uniref:Dbl homology domain-containing protein n=1 Tax=Lobosporangium transversale TaxID=64571 RepID=A0A1Y2GGF6_9FUNG|nr:Dbl homology domain-containing protein [Lobosporangium transversale]KAF9898046.1 hypothetical protein BX616_004565 [Lobosporangium transversale]ORZ10282.1 Dbl homology domain-containing protein [Lobosporangium transversale]|eukprot:XP_021879189.1 Dbl homology domain-containing protein [Lobosporangium transversale]